MFRVGAAMFGGASSVLGMLLAQSSVPAPGWEGFAQYGTIGGVAAMGLWFMYNTSKAHAARADRLEAQLIAVLEDVRKETTPALAQATAELARLAARKPR